MKKPHPPLRGPHCLVCGLGHVSALALLMQFTTETPLRYPEGKVIKALGFATLPENVRGAFPFPLGEGGGETDG